MNVEIMSLPLFATPPPRADARLWYGEGALQFGDLRLPPGLGPHPMAVVIHGGAWTARYSLDHIGHVAAALTARGIATWTIEFRRVGDPGGGYPGMFLDIAAGLDHLRHLSRDFPLDLDRIVPVGHSSGGHLALWAAGRRRLSQSDPLYAESPIPLLAVVSIAGIGDLRKHWGSGEKGRARSADLIGGSPQQYPDRYRAASPVELLPLAIPLVLIHGTGDTSVPIEYSESFSAIAGSAGDEVSLVSVHGAGHFDVIDPQSEHWPIVEGAIDEVFRSCTEQSR